LSTFHIPIRSSFDTEEDDDGLESLQPIIRIPDKRTATTARLLERNITPPV
jgi:hypothetical protein